MMNILEQSEALKGVPEDALMREMQQPTGSMPQFLVLTELKRRKRVRDEYNRRQAQDIPTVAEEVVMGAGMPQDGIMQMSKSMAPKSSIAQNTGQQEAAPKEPTMGMATGGILSLAKGNKLGKPVVYNGKTYMVTDKGEVFLNRRRVANRKLRDAVREAASSPDAMTESIAPLGSDFIEGASPNVPTSISQVDFDATAEPITPPSLDPKPESVGEDVLSEALRPADPGRIGQLMDTTQAGLAAQAAMDPSMGALESTGAGRALSPEEVLQGKIDAMPEQLADQQAAGLLDKFKSGVASLADRFRVNPDLTSKPNTDQDDYIRSRAYPGPASFDISQLPPEEIQGIATRRGMPEGFSGDPRLQGGIVEEMRGTGMPAAASSAVALELGPQVTPKSQQADAIDFSNITASPPTLSPMEIAARRNIAEQEATLPQRPLSIDATPPGFGAESIPRAIGTVGFGFDDLTANDRRRIQAGIDRRDAESRDLTRMLMDNQQSYQDAAFPSELTGIQRANQTLLDAASTIGTSISNFVTPEDKKTRILKDKRKQLGKSILAGRAGTQTGDAGPSDFDEALSGRPGIRSNPITGAPVLIEGFNKAFTPEKGGPLFPDGSAGAETTDTSLPITGDSDPDITFDLPKPQEERPNITLDPSTSKGDPDAIDRTTPAKPSSPSRTRSGTSGTGGSPLRSRIEELIADREKDREADKWMALAQTGLALMASNNPTLGGAIGEAGLVGVGAMKEAKSQYDKDMLELLGLQEEMRQADLSYSSALAKASQKALPKPRTPAEINAYLDYYRDIERKLGTVTEKDQFGIEVKTFDPTKVPQDIKDEIFRLEEQYKSLFPSATVNLADV